MPVFHRPLPDSLSVLRELAMDLHWSWNHAGDLLWKTINTDVWEQTQNPISVLQLTSDQEFQRLSTNVNFLQELQRIVQTQHDYLNKPSWYSKHYLSNSSPDKPIRGIAYFSMEFGLCEALPLYAGGLGMLAGDFLKTASDLGVPLIGIGLLYQEGYFRQNIASDGWQQETYLFNDPGNLPIQPLRAEDGTWLHIDTEFLCRHVRFRVWYVQVGKVKLYLLDSNDPCNQICDRGITSTLYGGNIELRLMQELALGICGWRLIERLGLDIDICHLNEGHAAFATLERMIAYRKKNAVDFETALWATRSGNIFTTHTAVAAGFDIYPEDLLRPYIIEIAQQLGVNVDDIIALGQAEDQLNRSFNMAYLAMHTCAYTNGVSELHGTVSQHIFQNLFPRWPLREVPVSHITNGIHIPSWDSPWADNEWTNSCGKDRWRAATELLPPEPLQHITDAELWQMAAQERAHLVDYVRMRLAHQLRSKSATPLCAVDSILSLDPNILTLGFARRFAEYKRSDLLLRDPERLARLLTNTVRPIQLIVAGKAHPADDSGKRALQSWHQFVQRDDVRHHVVFVEDYDITLAQQLVQGVDIWINTPRRPWEACGTSGMKILVNGGLNISTLDGWWAEAYEPSLGWAIGDNHKVIDDENNSMQHQLDDARDAEQLYQLLETQIIPLYYQRNEDGLPVAWLQYIRASMAKLTARFSSVRMLQNYLDIFYLPAAKNVAARQKNHGEQAKALQVWHRDLKLHWHEIHISELEIKPLENDIYVELSVYLGGISPATIKVQLVADPAGENPAQIIELNLLHPVQGAINAYCYTASLPRSRPTSDFTARLISTHPLAIIPAENASIYWQVRN